MRRAVALLLGLLAAAPAASQTLHVATTGSDATGDGSPGAPWATITHALDNAPDGALVLVAPGLYTGRVRIRGRFANGVTVRSEQPYQARLRHDATVLTIFDAQGVAIEGFDVAHSGPGSGALVVQVQDLIGAPGGADRVSRITLRDNVLHDSFDNDILKVNNGASDVLVEGNLLYNQTGSDEHVDVNGVVRVVLQDNVFFNDFAASGRANDDSTSSFVVVKDSAGVDPAALGSRDIAIRRNVFLNWQGNTGANFVLLGEDGQPFHETDGVIVENNLMIGNSSSAMRAAFGVKGGRNVSFRHNTVVGDLPSLAFAFRFNTEGANPPNENLQLTGNAWVDPTGTMEDFSDTPPGQTLSFLLDRNLYWNGGAPVPEDGAELVNPSDDAAAVFGDPLLADPAGVVPPAWDPAAGFADGSSRIREVFERLVDLHARPAGASALVDAADPATAPGEDILGRPRPVGGAPDLGCYELAVASPPGEPTLTVRGGRVEWLAAPGADVHSSYRGTIPARGLAARGLGLAAYDHSCLEAGDANGDGALATVDPEPVPAGAAAWYYLASGSAGGLEGSLGRASADLDPAVGGDQLERPNAAPCP